MVLVGNKCDLEQKREVSTAEGEELAKQYGIPFFETIALNNTNINKSFQALVREIRRFNNEIENKTPRKKTKRCEIM